MSGDGGFYIIRTILIASQNVFSFIKMLVVFISSFVLKYRKLPLFFCFIYDTLRTYNISVYHPCIIFIIINRKCHKKTALILSKNAYTYLYLYIFTSLVSLHIENILSCVVFAFVRVELKGKRR